MSKPFVKEKIELALEALHAACGYGKSESDTERFADLIHEASCRTLDDVEESHENGLCLNCHAVMSGYIAELLMEDLAEVAARN